MKYVYIQGDLVPENKALLKVADRAFKFSDGIFETIRVQNGKPYNLSFHEKRLKLGLKTLCLKSPANIADVANQLIKKNKLRDDFVRISVSSSGESTGYLAASANSIITGEVIDGFKTNAKNAKFHVSDISAQRLVNAKSKNALHYILAMKQAKQKSCETALLLDIKGYVCEFANGNVFWFKDDVLHTPSADLPFISGSIQSRVLKLYKGKIRQGKFKLSALKSADEIFMTNVSCLVQPFGKAKKSIEIKKLIEDDITKNCR